uniref:Polyketide synthase n=1 Tax=Byssovorax cruenta TaxID=293647 RepID=A0A1B3TNB2_9BACT|nr:polyketide synthase [Byssovorax cruenta]
MNNTEADYLARLRRAAVRVKELEFRLGALEHARTEPIAIIGLGCRFPGGGVHPEAFWKALREGVDGVSAIPEERWPSAAIPGDQLGTRWAGLLDAVDGFDAPFFGISPREAMSLDPQQRLLLEVAWEALEDAGQRHDLLVGSQTGVFLGIANLDYQHRVVSGSLEQIDAYSLTGNIQSTAAGRLSYVLGLEGPCVSVDTACSSSLVSVHLACQSLRHRESELALAGGVNLILSPATMHMLAQIQALSPDGRCKTFDARANGFVRGEGCGFVVLKRLSDAQRDGDRIWALIRGSAVNQDGRSTGLTTPNVLSQQALLRAALANAGVSPTQVGYVEAHGTGTSLGDPIELEALKEVLGQPRHDGSICALGSVKTNLGHLEAAAGIAGLIKAILALKHETIPRHLHFQTLNPRISLDATPFVVPVVELPWRPNGSPRIAGVSSFGISGTNAHLVLEEAPPGPTAAPEAGTSAFVLPLSAKSPQALSALSQAYGQFLTREASGHLADIAYTASVRRSHHAHRLAVVGSSREELCASLEAFARGEPHPGLVQGEALPGARPRVVFVYSGQGSQWAGMGRTLLEQEPVFRNALETCAPLIQQHAGFALLDVLAAPEDRSRLHHTEIAQPALFALQVALSALWRSWGVEPDAVLGHSVGEVAAAHLSGALSLEHAVRLVCFRGRVMQQATGLGKMASVALTPDAAQRSLQGYEDRLAIAAINDPGTVVLAGESAELAELLERLKRQGVDSRMLRVNYAFHSPQMAPFERELVHALGHLDLRPADLPMYSTVSGEPIDGAALTAAYWGRNLREPVAFAHAIAAAARDGHRVFVEIGPHPVLSSHITQCLGAREEPGQVVYSLRRDREERRTLLLGLGALYAQGYPVEWKRLYPSAGQCVPLPTYPWQRQRYWIEAGRTQRGAALSGHPLIGAQVPVAGASAVFETALGLTAVPYLSDHRVFEHVVVPGAAVLELAHAAAVAHAGAGRYRIKGLVLQAPLLLPVTGEQRVQVVLSEATAEGAEVTVYSQPSAAQPGEGWREHARGHVQSALEEGERRAIHLAVIRARCRTEVSIVELYATWREAGLAFGPAFRGITQLWCGEGEAVSRVELPEEARDGAAGYAMHPALLDAALQTLGAALGSGLGGEVCLPFEVDDFIVWQPGATAAWVHARRTGTPTAHVELFSGDLTVVDERGEVMAELTGVRLKRAGAAELRRTDGKAPPDWLYHLSWQEVTAAREAKPPSGTWLVLTEDEALGGALKTRLEMAGARYIPVDLAEEAMMPTGEAFRRALAALDAEGSRLEGVVYLWGSARASDAAPADRAEALTVAALHGVQALAGRKEPTAPRLLWVTQAAQAVSPGEAVAVAEAPLWGLGRVVMQEHPELECALLDLESDAGDAAEALWRELCTADDEAQVAWRAGKRYVARLVKAKAKAGPAIPDAVSYQLQTAHKGLLEHLRLVAAERRAPAAGEVEIQVEASGLNFRDVLNALGMYPGEAGPLGAECAGVVVAVGAGVTHVAVGDAVMALAKGAFCRFVTVDARLVAPQPAGLSMEQAATLPVVFLTALYALTDLGGLKAGERVLIHAAAGGVGMAAVQIARWIGAEVFATASPPKWDVVRAMGVEHVQNSRTLSFAEAFRTATQGQGVDVVLNALTGAFVDASAGLLCPGGRFLEMGKTDLRSASAMASAYPGVLYRAFDLMDAGPERIMQLFGRLLEGFASGQLRPLPVRSFAMTDAEAAFRFMAQARHVGKIALLAAHDRPIAPLCAESTVLITGGLGALGLHMAKWLWEQHHVKHLVLVGRSAPDGERLQAVEALRAAGARVTVAQADVADASGVRALLDAVPAELPLSGVIHAAGLLDDGVLAQQNATRFARVLSPKVRGAWNLHVETQGLPLRFFVMFSSAASVLGSAGQSSYAAGNAFLDALAQRRRAEGLPAQSLNWGPWAEGGMAETLDATQRTRLTRQGIGSLSPEVGLSLLEQALSRREVQLCILSLDARVFLQSLGGTVPPLWRALFSARPTRAPAEGGWAARLSALAPEARLQEVKAAVRAETAKVLGLSAAGDLPEKRPLKELGLDSLMAVELRNALAARRGKALPATLVFDYPTVEALARHLLDELLPATDKSAARPAPAKGTQDEPIAIVGIGCRFPGGVRDLDSFWRLLEQEVDAIGEVPKDRWDIDAYYNPDPDAPGKMTTRWGGFLERVDQFDPVFFEISPREAVSLDPQQRLLLEASWEALEQAGQTPEGLWGSDTGVYMGICTSEYQTMALAHPEAIDAYSLLGTAHSTTVGRLSYWLGLKGPNMPVDTACSSSLVAVHLACQALRAGECSLALAGGVSVILSPEGTVYFSKLRALSPTGRCHTFSADADGYVRSDGCGVVVLKRLSEAARDGDPILAVIRGSAVNQDGRSNGLTAPNGPSQEAVIRRALMQAGVSPSAVGYVETHGTGTPLGDPIEVQALSAVLSEGRAAEQPVVLGSVKTNLGHTEAAAGVAGLIKAVLSLQRETIPKSLHFSAPNPYIPWEQLPVKVAAEAMPWPRNGAPRIAGVSSFGFSGTNAHLVLEEAPRCATTEPIVETSPLILPLSAKSPHSLSALAESYATFFIEESSRPLADIAYTASVRRSHHAHRLALVGRSREELRASLEAFGRGEASAGVVQGEVKPGERPKVVFVYSGQGSQWAGMGRQLLEEEPVFRRAIEACEPLVKRHAGFSLLEELAALEDRSRVQETEVAQPALFAIHVALSALWTSWGVRPDAVIGHSVGEVAAAHLAGAMSLEEAVRLVCCRGRVMQRATGFGKMASVALSPEEASRALRGYEDRLSIAAVNDPGSVVLSGEAAALADVVERLEQRQVRCRMLQVNYAFHSPQMGPLAGEFAAALGLLETRPAKLSMYSTVSGDAVLGEGLDPAYWARNVREPVEFARAVEKALHDGHGIFVEVGPHPVLSGHLEQCLDAQGKHGQVVYSLRRERDERRTLLLALGALYAGGHPVAWKQLYPSGGRCVPLPAYPWQRKRYWIEAARGRAEREASPTWLYQLAWQAATLGPKAEPGGTWLVLSNGAALGHAVAERLKSAGARCITVGLGERAAPAGTDLRVEDPSAPHAFAPALRAVDAADAPLKGVVCLWSVERAGAESTPADRALELTVAALHFLQALASREAPSAPRLWWVTEGAQPVCPGEAVAAAEAPLWGLGRVVMQEHPELGCTLLDLESGVDNAAEALWQELCAADDETQVAWRAGKRHVARLVKAPGERGQVTPPAIAAESTVLITGGLGALGLSVARWLWKEHQVKHLLLVGRSAPEGARLQAVEALRAEGARVAVAQADVADRAAVQELLASVPAELPLSGVIHAAGVLDDGVLAQQNAARFARVLAPKVRGAWNLHVETRALPLRFFVMFSSVASVLGSAGQSNYAAANAFLDALAQQRRVEGLAAQSLNWGPWAEGGMAETLSPVERTRLRRQGIGSLSSAQGVTLLGQALSRSEAQLCVLPLNLRALEQVFATSAVPPVWRALVEPRPTQAPEAGRGGWAAELSLLAPGAQLSEVETVVRAEVAKVLGIEAPGEVPVDRPLQELGYSSLMALELRNALAARLGKALPATLVFNYPTVEALARHLLDHMRLAPAASAALPISVPTIKEEPIAIVGIGCRYPGGVRDPDSFWRLLEQGVDAISVVPKERWDIDAYYDPDPEAQGKMVTRWGGFLSEVDHFDPGFFEISPREAVGLDPQQRLLLEVSWEALEQAGQTPERLWGSDTGVYMGLCSNEYQTMAKAQAEPLEPYMLLGTAHSTSVARLSYWLGLKGPNMPVDTACSSSLVAVHLACQALRAGECSLALAGGVNLILSPETTVCLSGMRAMSPTGRCHTFSGDADGYVRSDGCGVVVLKRLSDAARDGDPVLAVIRGSAVNQDGRSNGLTAPSGPAQEAVIRRALAQAGVSPSAVGYVEAHGTGTPLGDPIEVQALSAVLSEGRAPEQRVVVGSVKTNIGHTEAAAGVAGLIKAVLSLQRGSIPKSLHFSAPNPHIPWEQLPVKVATESVPWKANGAPRIAGVSSFGISGTNAHVVLEETPAVVVPEPTVEPMAEDTLTLLPLSAHRPEALNALVEEYGKLLAEEAAPRLHDIAYTASVRRSHHAHRLALVGRSREELRASLEAFGRGEANAGVVQGEAKPGARPKVVFVYPGQGSQWVGMGRQLLDKEPVFRRAMEACDEAIRAEAGFSLLEALAAEAGRSELERIDVIQPALFAMGVSLSALWRSWGVEPDAVVGHSMGEVAAAHVAGALTLHQAAQIICRRSRLLLRLRGQGAMALVELSLAQAEEAVRGHEDRLSVAVSNSPRSTVLSGHPAALEEVLSQLVRKNVFCRQVKVDVASHSPQMDALRGELLEALEGLLPSTAKLPMYSTVTGCVIEGAELAAAYWVRNLRDPVRFAESVQQLLTQGHTLFVEMSPHPILLPAIEEGLRHAERQGAALPSLRREQDERRVLHSSLGALYAHGYAVQWKQLYPSAGRCVPLPAYPFQRERYWMETARPANGAAQRPQRSREHAQGHPLLGASFTVVTQPGARFWETALSVEALPYLADHRVEGEIVLPGAAYVEMALSAASEVYGQGAHAVEDIVFERMLALPPAGVRTVQAVLTEQGAGQALFQVSSREATDNTWVRHATASVRAFGLVAERASEGEAPAAIQKRCPTVVSGPEHYQQMEERGIAYGPRFQGVEQLWAGAGEALGRVRLPDEQATETLAYTMHPAFLDACFQAMSGLFSARDATAGGEGTYVPVGVTRVRLERRPRREGWVHGRLRAGEEPGVEGFSADLRFFGDDGQPLGEALGLRLKPLSNAALGRHDPYEHLLYAFSWHRKDHGAETRVNKAPPSPGAFLLWMDKGGTGAALSLLLQEQGERVVRVLAGEQYARLEEGLYQVDPSDPEGYRSVLRDAFGGERACRGVVHLFSLDATAEADTSAETLLSDQRLSSLSALYLAQALLRAGFRDLPRLLLVTRGTQAVGAEAATLQVSQAPVWGLGRTLSIEHPELGCTCVDLSPARAAKEAATLFQELVSSDGEEQIALREQGRYVARLVQTSFSTNEGTVAPPLLEPASGRPFRLEIAEPGVLERLTLRETERRPPGPSEVEIEVGAASLNFIDVMKSLGIYPGLASGPISLGAECAGRIVRVGDSVTGLTLGQEVVAVAPGSLSSHVTVPAGFVVPKPRSLGVEEASSVSNVFMTVWYALLHLGRLREGEQVLIHSAAGGVGLAAVQIAQRVGAEIFATAGTPEKRELLRSMGIRHVMDSRSLAFADEVLSATRGKGVDVVLNSLSGEAIPKSLSVLAHDGRFLEIGKRDIYADRPLGLSHFRKSLSYAAIDLAGLSERKPALVGALLREVMAEFEAGRLKPLPYQLFPVMRVEEAFRVMARGQHVGKIVVSMHDPEVRIAKAMGANRLGIQQDGSYLITGGLGGLGLSVAAWMVHEGARHLVLVGRRGASEAARAAIKAMEEAGAQVRIVSADVSQRADVERVLQGIEADLPPLLGIVHAAGVLDDRTMLELSREPFDKVMAPKMQGAWNLHSQTRNKRLSFFVLYSSAAALIGSPGQGNYAAANAFLDALAHSRRRLGLPGLSIDWGTFAEVGLAAAQQIRGERLAYRGVKGLSPAQGVEVLGRLLSGEQTQVGVLDLNLRQWLEFYPSAARSPLWTELLKEQRRSAQSAQGASHFRQALESEKPDRRRALLEQHLCEQLSRVLRLPASRIDRLSGFSSLGMDSLMSLELRNRLEASLGLKLSATLLFTYSNLAALAEHLLDRMGLGGEANHGASPKRVEETAVEVPELMDVEQFADDDILNAFDASLNRIKAEKLG